MKRIVIIGPESTGKSTLCNQLAAHYDTVWCPEFAREYLLKKKTPYTFEDLHQIAAGQITLEACMQEKANNSLYFIDTDLYVMKVWYEVAFNKCPTWILKKIARTQYDLYLLCNTDLPWKEDELREYPEPAFRKKLFKMYKDVMINSCTPWAEISGSDEERLHAAIKIVDSINRN